MGCNMHTAYHIELVTVAHNHNTAVASLGEAQGCQDWDVYVALTSGL